VRNVYPSKNRDVLERARRHGLDPDTLHELELISDREYETFADAGFELGGEAPL
jgi:hypothetical protein